MSGADAEAMLKKIRKMEANRICPNCETPSPTGLGFGNICIKVFGYIYFKIIWYDIIYILLIFSSKHLSVIAVKHHIKRFHTVAKV